MFIATLSVAAETIGNIPQMQWQEINFDSLFIQFSQPVKISELQLPTRMSLKNIILSEKQFPEDSYCMRPPLKNKTKCVAEACVKLCFKKWEEVKCKTQADGYMDRIAREENVG